MKRKKIIVSVGIAAYNAEKNIGNLLEALLHQKESDFHLAKIIVHSDASGDETVHVVKSFKSNKVVVIDNKNRKGFAGSVKELLRIAKGDVVVLLNDDIKIKDPKLISKLIQPFLRSETVGLVGGHAKPLPSINFVENAAISSWKAYDGMRKYVKNGNSIYSCDGKILALSRSFIQKLNFPSDLKEMGNTDAYLYFACLYEGFEFNFNRGAEVFGRMPQKLSDLINWQIRNNSNRSLLRKKFGTLVDTEYRKPRFIFWRCLFTESFKNPAGCIFIFFFSFYIQSKAKNYSKNFNPTWNVIATSKNL